MRRLPVYFLIDVSDSMLGEPIAAVNDGLQSIVGQLRYDPYALETVYIGCIVFAGQARVVKELTELPLFKSPAISVGPGTNLAAGLNLLMDCLEKDVQKTTLQKKGDWRPIIFLFTDGAPTSDTAQEIKRWQKDYQKHANLVIVTFGKSADVNLLLQLSETVLNLADMSAESFAEFFKWVSASLQTSSQAVAENAQDSMHLAQHGICLEKARPARTVDENFAILPMRCTRDKVFWLAKYGAHPQGPWLWELVNSYKVDEEAYKSLSGKEPLADTIDLNTTDKDPVCPICGASGGIVRCRQCNGLSCLQPGKSGNCPWCGAYYAGVQPVENLKAVRSRG